MTPSNAWTESVAPDENPRFERYAEQLRELQRKRTGGKQRALHVKANLGLEAEFTVLPDLPEHVRLGLFAAPASFRAYARFSNGAAAHQSDRKDDVRGLAFKVVGVKGTKIIPGMESAPTQDFLLIRTSSQPFKNPDEFVNLIMAITSPLTGLPKFIARFGFGRTLAILKKASAGFKKPQGSLAATPFFSALPIRFGSYAVRYALVPQLPVATEALPKSSADYLGEELAGRLREGPVSYDFQVQFFVDETKTPIEDSSVDWTPETAPYLTVGRLTLAKQDPSSPRGKSVAEFVEKLSFDPWHALTELRPLGAMMRARNNAYRLSTQERKAAPEPDGSETFG